MAQMEKWRDDPEEELVKIFQRSELSTFWTSNIDLIIGPGETLVWIRDGKIEDIVTQARLNNVAGGFRNWIASKSSGGKEIKMMIIDNKPFEIVIGADGYTKHDIEQSGTAKLTMRLNHEQANRLAGVLKEKAIKVTKGFFITRTDIEQMIADEARNKVFGPVMKNFESADFGNRQLVGKVESAAQIELRKTMELWGMSLENIYVDWNRNAYQEWKAERAPNLWQEKARREFEIDETSHTEKVTDIKADAARERRKKDSQQDVSELSELMKIKEQMNQQKMDRKRSAADSELEIEKVKAQAQIESAKHNLDSYKDAQAAESEKMLRMMEIMQGKKRKEDDE